MSWTRLAMATGWLVRIEWFAAAPDRME